MDKKISELEAVVTPQLTDVLAVVNEETTKKITIGEVVDTYTKDTLKWVRYDDGQYTSTTPLTVTNGSEVRLVNDGENNVTVSSSPNPNYYDPNTGVWQNLGIQGGSDGDVFVATVVFKTKTDNANQTYGHIKLVDIAGGGSYERLTYEFNFPKGNGSEHNEHFMFQYYTDSNFISQGAELLVGANGGDIDIYDVIYFIRKVHRNA